MNRKKPGDFAALSKEMKMKIDNLDIQDKIIQPGGVAVICVKTSFEKLKLKMLNIKNEYERT